MKTKLILIAITILYLPIFNLWASEEKREVGSFSIIELPISANVYVSQGNKTELVIKGSADDIKNIATLVEGETLKIKTKPGTRNFGETEVFITIPEIQKISISGSGNVIAKERITCSQIKIELSGSGDVKFIDLQANHVEASISGSGDIELIGKCKDRLSIAISGSGDINTGELEAKEVTVKISGSGVARVFATEKLNTSIAGSGSVFYKGNPLIDAKSSGSGRTISQ